jgi:homoserine kinase
MTGRVPFTQEALLRLAVEIEGHPDNVTPALVGGFTVSCMNGGEPLFVRFDPPPELKAVIVMPEVPFKAKKTQVSRGVLPEAVTLKDAVYNLNRAALLVAALAQGRIDLMGVAMEDRLHQPYRASLYKGMASVLQAGMAAGAKGVALSGAGPAVLAFVVGDESAVVHAMESAFNWAGSEARSLVVPLAREGARIEE